MRSGTSWTVGHAPCLEYGHIVQRRVLRAAIEETQQLVKKPLAKVREDNMHGVVFRRHKKVNVMMERHPAMVYNNHKAGCLLCQNVRAKNPQTRWRCKGTSTPPPEPAAPLPGRPSPPGMSPAIPGYTEANESYEIECMPSRYVYMHSPLPNNQFFNYNAFAKDSKSDKDIMPDLLRTICAVWKFRWNWFWWWQQHFGRISG
jgi:hypothetical protein